MKKTFKVLFFILFLIVIMLIYSKVEAATTANAVISANKTTATVGDKVTVTVSIYAVTWNINLSGEVSESIVGYNMDLVNQKTTKTYNIDTSKAGKYTVTLSGDVTDAETNEIVKYNGKSVTITVSEKTSSSDKGSTNQNTSTTKKSSDATLSTLGVLPDEYDFNNFSKNKTSYSVTVPNEVDELKVQCETSNKKASAKVSGNTNLVVGSSNKISVVVTAEDGTKKTYTIKVTKLAKDEEKEGNLIDEENDDKKDEENKLKLEKLVVKNYVLSPEFSSDVYSYKIDVNMEENDIDKLELEYSANSSDAKIEVVGNENLKEGENIITIMVSDEKTEEKTIYQIIVNKTKPEEQTQEVLSTIEKDDNNIINKGKNILITIFVVLIVLIFGTIILIHFREKKLNEDTDNQDKSINNTDDNDKQKDTFYEKKENDKNLLNKINKKNKGKHF